MASSSEKTLAGRSELAEYVGALSCEATQRLGRLLEIPDRTRLKKKQLAERIVAYFVRAPESPLLKLRCANWLQGCSADDFQAAFETRINDAYEGERKAKTAEYEGKRLDYGRFDRFGEIKQGDRFAKCQPRAAGAVIFVHEDDTYAFRLNGVVKIVVQAQNRVEIVPSSASSIAASSKLAQLPSSSSSSSSSPSAAPPTASPPVKVRTGSTRRSGGGPGTTAESKRVSTPSLTRRVTTDSGNNNNNNNDEVKSQHRDDRERSTASESLPIPPGFGSDGSDGPPETTKSLLTRGTAREMTEVLGGVWNSALNWNNEAARGIPAAEDDQVEDEKNADDEDEQTRDARRQRRRAEEERANPEIGRVQVVVDRDAALDVELRDLATRRIVTQVPPIRVPGTYGLRQFLQRLALEFTTIVTRAVLSEADWNAWRRREFGYSREADRDEAGYEGESDGGAFLGDLGRRRRSEREPTLGEIRRVSVRTPVETLADRDFLSMEVAGYELRFRGALACYLGYPATSVAKWSAWRSDIGVATLVRVPGRVDFAPPGLGGVARRIVRRYDGDDERGGRGGSQHLRFAVLGTPPSPTADDAGAFRIALLPGGFFEAPRKTDAGAATRSERETAERDRKAQLSQSAVALGMAWADSPELYAGDSWTLPNAVAASLYARPTFGAGERDCAPGWLRQPGDSGCCVYVLEGALRTINVDRLDACLAGDCKATSRSSVGDGAALDARDEEELKNYVRGVREGQAALNGYVGGLHLTPAQLQWTLTMADNVRTAWLAKLTQQMNDVFEAAGLSVHDEDCQTEEQAGELVPSLGVERKAAAAKKAPPKEGGGGGRLRRAFFAIGGAFVRTGYTLAVKLGQGLCWALRWLWWFAKNALQVAGNLVAAGATKGMQIASWILADPRQARFVLVLVRRMRITLCKRVGLYLYDNGYATDLRSDEARGKLDALREQTVVSQWTSDVSEDAATLVRQELSPAKLAAAVYGGVAGSQATKTIGTVLQKGLQGALQSVPFVGGFLAAVSEVVADTAGDSLNAAVKQALEVQRINADIGNTLELLRDIFDLNGALADAGLSIRVDYAALLAALLERATAFVTGARERLAPVAALVAPVADLVGERLVRPALRNALGEFISTDVGGGGGGGGGGATPSRRKAATPPRSGGGGGSSRSGSRRK